MNKDFKQVVDDRLSGVRMSHELQMNILNKTREEGEIIVKKKISAGLVLAIAGVLAATVVLAAGLLFSPRYDASKLANEAMLNKYGITDKLMSVFQREAVQNTNGSLTITYAPAEGVFRYGENYLGVYTVTVENGKAEAVWSHDGENTSGGLDAKAGGAEQVELLVTDYETVMKILFDRAGTPPA